MSKKQAFWLGIDCGGTYLKAGLYDAEGHEWHCAASATPHNAMFMTFGII